MSQEAALLSDGYFMTLPGTVQTLEVNGRMVYQAPGARPAKGEKGRTPKALLTLALPSEAPLHYAEIALIQEAFKPGDVQEHGPRCYQLVSDHLDRALTDLVFERLSTRTDLRRGETICELSFSDYDLVRET